MSAPEPQAPGRRVDPAELERARLFALLGRLLGGPPDAGLLTRLAALGGTGPLGEGFRALAEAARATDPDAADREFFALFLGAGRDALRPCGSRYLTGGPDEQPLAALRRDLTRLGVGRAPGVSDPEDHVAFLCETFAGLLAGAFPALPEEAGAFFAQHLRPWAGRFFAELEAMDGAPFYRAVGRLGRLAVEAEQAAADVPA